MSVLLRSMPLLGYFSFLLTSSDSIRVFALYIFFAFPNHAFRRLTLLPLNAFAAYRSTVSKCVLIKAFPRSNGNEFSKGRPLFRGYPRFPGLPFYPRLLPSPGTHTIRH